MAVEEGSESLGVFSFVNSINENKKDLLQDDPFAIVEYIPFVVNRAMANSIDTLFDANEMNLCPTLDKDVQYRYYLTNVSKKKRRAKWFKKEKIDRSIIDLLIVKYGYSEKRAIEAAGLLSEKDVGLLKQSMEFGGRKEKV